MGEQAPQTLRSLRAVPEWVGDDPSCGFARRGRSFAGLVQGQAASQRCQGHFHALVVAQVALAEEFLVEDFGAVLALVPALL
ncbi:hypothetical protein AR457_35135 [Streptomyces agglomeratus]|uniref:Uncharacterized protein n=1 Tax=Streptomyces agglomeratus TaxID=285458 RepID=A0A1E5PGM8_9ACTN|nr:hypothetical protein AS594_33910 [Streptomyces agglomeratus]OEJ37210.1 hypothetical protein BGK70_02625 [Streptomyces agglomeratus]OEJ48565.1 hypothetical protein AR457_35135 [Streptomyces agglomeratus]OEJ49767.1 hypothetical protein BGK72_02175 [Streptomyces agglomeratus]OEJ57070.1 hypothetical protein BGM19_02730 [Streptomyces agglomeratus]